MQIAAHVANAPSSIGASLPEVSSSLSATSTFADYKVIRRNGAVVSLEPPKISVAVTWGRHHQCASSDCQQSLMKEWDA